MLLQILVDEFIYLFFAGSVDEVNRGIIIQFSEGGFEIVGKQFYAGLQSICFNIMFEVRDSEIKRMKGKQNQRKKSDNKTI